MSYDYPASYIYWYVNGDDIAIVQNNSVTSGNIVDSINESLQEAVMVEVTPKFTEVQSDNENKIIDISRDAYRAIIEYVKWQLYLDGKDEIAIVNARKHEVGFNRFKKKIGKQKISKQTVNPYKLM